MWWVVHNKIKKGLLLSVWVLFLNRWIFDKVIATACNGVNASATLWGDAEGIKEQLQREESPFVGRQRRPYRESLPACVKPAELVLNENSCENCDNYASWLQFMSLFELIEAPHRAHNAKNVNCRINLSQFGYQPPPHLKYIPTLPCNLSLMACFADTNVSQGSVATYARCGGIFNMHLTANLRRNLLVKVFNRLRFDRIMVVSLWPYLFWPTLYSLLHVSWGQCSYFITSICWLDLLYDLIMQLCSGCQNFDWRRPL